MEQLSLWNGVARRHLARITAFLVLVAIQQAKLSERPVRMSLWGNHSNVSTFNVLMTDCCF